VAQANVKLTVDARGATKALQDVNNKTNKLQKSFGGLRTAIAGIGIGLLARNTVKTTANFQALQIRMRVLTSEFGEFAQVQKLVTKAQDKFNLSIVEATQGITDIFARLRPLGVSLKDIETTFMGFNSIAVVAGLNAQEASAAFTQLAQGLGSGRLQGDEFRSIAEQVPQLLKAISDETGIATGKLKDFASKGLLKSDIIIRALSKSAEGLGKQIDDIIDESPAQKFKKLNNELLELQLTLGSKLTPALADGAVALASLVEGFSNFIDSEQGQVALIITGVVLATKALGAAIAFATPFVVALKTNLATMAIAAAAANGKLGASATLSFAAAGGFTKAAIAARGLKIALAKLGIGLVVIALGQLAANLMAARNAQKQLNDIIEKGSIADIKEQIEKANESIDKFKKNIEKFEKKGFKALAKGELEKIEKAKILIGDLEKALEKAQARALTKEFEKTKKALEEKNKELLKTVERTKIATKEGKKQFDQEQRRIELTEKYGEELANIILKLEKENEKLEEGAEKIKKKQEETDKLKEKMAAVGEEIESSIKNNLRDAITGAKSFGEAMTNVLNRIRDKILDAQIDKLLGQFGENFGKGKDGGKGLGGFLGGILGGLFADGGRPPVGKASVVGERGPELFVPKVAGTIFPNNKLGGGDSITNIVNVSVDASGSSVEGDNATSQELGQTIALVVQETLVREKRNGGLLA